VAFDLSKVLFITTGNILQTIPPALQDRMEVLEFPGYTEGEKIGIAKRHLVAKQLESHGIPKGKLRFKNDALREIIRNYTREAGLRNLEREIANVCRKFARKLAEGEELPENVTSEDVAEMLGSVKFFQEVKERMGRPGVAVGLAWTQAGGDIIFVEAAKMKGKGGLVLTGQLGDVMKESAQAALTYIRSRAVELGIDEDLFGKNDIHIHVPAGAIPKDGPSAGVTMTVALASLLMGVPVRPDVAMTGEITLRGNVLPVGGIKEKILAAKRAEIRDVILPQRNEKDLADVGEEIQKGMKFDFVKDIDDVLKLAMEKNAKKPKKKAEKKAKPAEAPA
jgi:ATP-dependent Lon protease